MLLLSVEPKTLLIMGWQLNLKTRMKQIVINQACLQSQKVVINAKSRLCGINSNNQISHPTPMTLSVTLKVFREML